MIVLKKKRRRKRKLLKFVLQFFRTHVSTHVLKACVRRCVCIQCLLCSALEGRQDRGILRAHRVQALSSLLSVLPLSLQERNRALLPSPRNYRRICFSKSLKKQKTFFPLKTTTITLILNVQCFSLSHTDRNSIIASPILIVWILIFFPFYCFVFVLCF